MNALDFALRYAALGWACFPLQPREKVPATPHGVLDATTDQAKLGGLFRDPRANIGVSAGASGLVIVDVDPRNGGNESMRELVAQHGRLPRTPRAQTGSGGAHVVYLAPAEVKLRAKLAPGVDLLRGNAYFVASPSVHPNGRRYTWDVAALPSCTPLADLPSWIVDLARADEAPAPQEASQPVRRGVRLHSKHPADPYQRAHRWLERCDPSIQGSHGSRALMHAVVGLVRGFSLPEEPALALLVADFNPTCRPPWSERELRHALVSAQRSSKPMGYLLEQQSPRRIA